MISNTVTNSQAIFRKQWDPIDEFRIAIQSSNYKILNNSLVKNYERKVFAYSAFP